MIHVDHNHPSTSPLKSSASAAALDSFTWDVGSDDPFGTTTTGASGMGAEDGLGSTDTDPTGQLSHTQDFRPEEFLNDDLGDVMHLAPEDVDGVGDGLGGMDPLGLGSAATSSLQPPPPPASSNTTISPTNNATVDGIGTPGPPTSSSLTDTGFLASPMMREGDRSSSLSPVPDTASPSGQGEGGSAGEGGEEKEAEAPAEEPRKEEEEEEEGVNVPKAEPSREITPLSPLTPPADELDGEGEVEVEEKKEGEKKSEESTIAGKSIQQQKQQQLQQQQQRGQQQGRQTTKSPANAGGGIPNAAAAFMQQQSWPSPDTAIPTPDLISPSNTNNRDPKVVKVLDLNVELFK